METNKTNFVRLHNRQNNKGDGIMKLKASIVTAIAVALFSTVLVAGTSFAAGCSNVSVAGIATTSTSITPSGMSVRLVNQSGGTCASSWANGSEVKFFLSNENTDRSVAIILTAMSLGKNLWVDVSGGATGSIVNVVNLTN